MGGWLIFIGFVLFLMSPAMGRGPFFLALGCIVLGFAWGGSRRHHRHLSHRAVRGKTRGRMCTNSYCRCLNEPTARFCERCGRPLNV